MPNFNVEDNFDYTLVTQISNKIRESLGEADLAITLGSGLGGFGSEFPNMKELKYEDAGLPPCYAKGHAGVLRYFKHANQRVLVLDGRCHLYEGHSSQTVTLGVRAATFAGAKTHILTCASGSIQTDWKPGTLVVLADFLDLTGVKNPAVGFNHDTVGPRFPDMSAPFDKELMRLAIYERDKLGLNGLPPGTLAPVHATMLGPCYETPAQVRMLKNLGAHLVGMSTAPETIALRHLGTKVLAIALITNLAAGIPGPMGEKRGLSHEEVVEEGKRAAQGFRKLLLAIIEQLPTPSHD